MGKKAALNKRAARAERRRDQTRAEILETAREVVLRDGLAPFRLSAVSDELGLTLPALYYYYPSKEALVFDLLLSEWVASAEEVEAAVAETETGVDAVEALIRTVFERYCTRLELFRICYMKAPSGEAEVLIGPEQLSRIRPVNGMLFGGAEERVRRDQKAGRFSTRHQARRYVFTAYASALGLLNTKAMTEGWGDPLVHADKDLIATLCTTFRQAARV